QRCLGRMDADSAPLFSVGALTAQRATVAARTEARNPRSVTFRGWPDHHQRTSRTANGLVGQIDLEGVLGELAVGRRRRLNLHVGLGACTLDRFDELRRAVRRVTVDLDWRYRFRRNRRRWRGIRSPGTGVRVHAERWRCAGS